MIVNGKMVTFRKYMEERIRNGDFDNSSRTRKDLTARQKMEDTYRQSSYPIGVDPATNMPRYWNPKTNEYRSIGHIHLS